MPVGHFQNLRPGGWGQHNNGGGGGGLFVVAQMVFRYIFNNIFEIFMDNEAFIYLMCTTFESKSDLSLAHHLRHALWKQQLTVRLPVMK